MSALFFLLGIFAVSVLTIGPAIARQMQRGDDGTRPRTIFQASLAVAVTLACFITGAVAWMAGL